MKTLWCWRCKMEIPMLDEDEFITAHQLYRQAFRAKSGSLEERFQPLLDYYNDLKGFGETVPLAIMHHRISQYGIPCGQCGKPYRTPRASFCAACGYRP